MSSLCPEKFRFPFPLFPPLYLQERRLRNIYFPIFNIYSVKKIGPVEITDNVASVFN